MNCCAGPRQSAIDSAGPPADGIERLWWVFFWLLFGIFVIVMAFLAGSLSRRSAGAPAPPERDIRLGRTVAGASIVTVLILFVLILVSVRVGQSTSVPKTRPAMTIEVMGNQWWWYVRYTNDVANRIAVTANEIHIPVGKAVMIRGTSNDVIHSFWAPNLQGKRDLIPSRVTINWIQADRPGAFRGQCAEFCGLQHAHMAFWVVAQTEHDFEQWFNTQLAPAANPTTPIAQRGQEVFLNNACRTCHNISGTPAAGQVGPDLTHVGSRLSLAAGTLPNNVGSLTGWIADPQTIKPGNHMATVPISSDDLQAVAEYLESLK
ncbi:MAG: c-type cytochrome [Acidobacteriaceae bacterium]|nr:c-type cytochrome [Acidobacteriaceae bacterium]